MPNEQIQLLQDELKKIEKWEKDQSGLWFWERIGRLPFKLLDKITPTFIHKKIGVLLDELGNYISTGGKYLTSEKQVLRVLEKQAGTPVTRITDVEELPLEVMERASLDLAESRIKWATVQGATTGIGGIFTLALDIPALLGISLKTLQEIAIIHGYDPNDKNERVFIVKCLQFSSADVVGKKAILNELSHFYNREAQSKEMLSQLQGWREVIYTYRDQYGWKKFFQMIPIAGILFGAFNNRSMLQDITEAGTMLYRKRRIMERIRQLENQAELPDPSQ